MARNVYPTREIAHLWAHRTQEQARNPQGNFYFSGDTICSYGSHFPIARHITNKAGARAVLMTTRSYSSTTNKHQSLVWRAVPDGATVIRVHDVDLKPKEVMAEFDKRITDQRAEVYGPTNRFRPREWESLERLVSQANDAAEFFGYKKRWDAGSTDTIRAAIQRDRDRQQRADAKRQREQVKAEAERRQRAEAELKAWLNGERVGTYNLYMFPPALRIVGDNIETSHGVNFPIDHARRAIPFIRQLKAEGREYVHNGHSVHLGHYTIDRIDADSTVHAGCHHVPYSEVERIAGLLGM